MCDGFRHACYRKVLASEVPECDYETDRLKDVFEQFTVKHVQRSQYLALRAANTLDHDR